MELHENTVGDASFWMYQFFLVVVTQEQKGTRVARFKMRFSQKTRFTVGQPLSSNEEIVVFSSTCATRHNAASLKAASSGKNVGTSTLTMAKFVYAPDTSRRLCRRSVFAPPSLAFSSCLRSRVARTDNALWIVLAFSDLFSWPSALREASLDQSRTDAAF